MTIQFELTNEEYVALFRLIKKPSVLCSTPDGQVAKRIAERVLGLEKPAQKSE